MDDVTAEPAASRRGRLALGAGLSLRRLPAGVLTGLVVLPLLTVVLAQLRDTVNLPSQTLLYVLAVVVVGLVGGLVPALAAALAAAVLLDHYFIPPLGDFAVADPDNVVALVTFVLVAGAASWVVGLAARRRAAELLATANAAGREEFRRLADEQAALRRVATLVARGAPAPAVFGAIAQEVGHILGADSTNVVRFEPEEAATVVASVGTQRLDQVPVGTHWTPQPPLATATVMRTGRPARSDDYSHSSGVAGDAVRRLGIRSGIAVPIVVEGRLWGAIAVGTQGERFPADAEQRMADFLELAATAIANTEAHAQLEESRDALGRLADEQAALRRVATLVARGVPAADVFTTVAQEVGHILATDSTTIVRLDPDGAVAILTRVGDPPDDLEVGSRVDLEPPLPIAVAVRTGRAARLDDFSQAADVYGENLRRLGMRSGIAAPIIVEGHVWGAIGTGTRREHLPADSEQRLTAFTELIGTAIANAESRAQLEANRDELRRLADEQAALRRVATLVARGVPAAEVFMSVALEVDSVLANDATNIVRLDPDGAVTILARNGARPDQYPVGGRWTPQPPLALAVALRTGHPARLDDFNEASDAYGDAVRQLGIRSGAAAPIVVEGRLWGAIAVGGREQLPADTEQRLADFTELVGTAIANADSRAQLTASRARIVATADQARRRIERDLHDGIQQRLVALGLTLRLTQARVPAQLPELQTRLGRIGDELTEAIDDLRELARGIHPAILSQGGLGPALRTLARRAALPVELDIQTESRPADPVEVAAYYVVSEALTNTTKHAHASHARVAVHERDALLQLSIRDDGVGGADPSAGSGLIGLSDRVQALGGSIEVTSPPGNGTLILVDLPLQPD